VATSQQRTSSANSGAHVEEKVTTAQWLALIGTLVGAFMAILDIQITNASIQYITGGLGANLDDGSWISTAYLAAEIVIIPLSGYLSQVLSLKRYTLWTSALFLVFSIGCGFSWNLASMIVFRALQGITGGALIPLAFQVILSLPPSKRTIGMALFSLTATFGPAIGPTIGGYLTESIHWSAIFFMNLGPGAVTMVMIATSLKAEPINTRALKNFDYWGISFMAIGLASLTIFLEEGERKDWFGNNIIATLFFAAVIFITAFLIRELTAKNPFINLRLLKQRNFGLGCTVNFVVGMALYGALYLVPMFLTTIPAYNSVQIGETVMWVGLPQLVVLPFVPKLLKWVDSRWVACVGIIIFGASCLMNSRLTVFVGKDQLMWSQIVRAIGQPMLMVPLTTITTGYITREQSGSASGIFNMLRNLGGSVGIAGLSTILTRREQFHSERIGEGVSMFFRQTRHRLFLYQQQFMANGLPSFTAQQKAIGQMGVTVQQQAFVMAFNDCFFILGVALILASVMILACRKVGSGGEVAAH
jgi:MFS transporter, DHA2 family, multidrug resistance protein